jgi:hypothetical protein
VGGWSYPSSLLISIEVSSRRILFFMERPERVGGEGVQSNVNILVVARSLDPRV